MKTKIFFSTEVMEQTRNVKREQIKALAEKMKQEGKPIDWATIVLC